MGTPKWADELVAHVCAECGVEPPPIQWQRSSTSGTSGRAWPGNRIHVRCGRDSTRDEQRRILLHELAHYLLPVGEHHSRRFYTLAFLFYYRYGAKIRAALADETRYRPRAARAGYQEARRLRHHA